MSSRAAARMVKQNFITTAGGTYVRFGVSCSKNGANTGLQIKLSDQSPLAENVAKGPCFHLLELTQRVGLRGEKT